MPTKNKNQGNENQSTQAQNTQNQINENQNNKILSLHAENNTIASPENCFIANFRAMMKKSFDGVVADGFITNFNLIFFKKGNL